MQQLSTVLPFPVIMVSVEKRLRFPTNMPAFKKDDPRLGTIISSNPDDAEDADLVLIGFPFDEGVRRNGGRLGAAGGPAAVRESLGGVGTIWNPELSLDFEIQDKKNRLFKIFDSGDIQGEDEAETDAEKDERTGRPLAKRLKASENVPQRISLEHAHGLLEQRVFAILCRGKHAVVLGGSDDQSYANAIGFLRSVLKEQEKRNAVDSDVHPLMPVVINIDAHLDCRTRDDEGRVHSGCPFRLMQESEEWRRFPSAKFIVYGCQGQACSKEHVDYVRKKGGTLFWLSHIREYTREQKGDTVESTRLEKSIKTQAGKCLQEVLRSYPRNARFYLSFDIDSISSACCPGVSAPSVVGGLTSAEAADICLLGGLDSRVKLLGLAEFNPKFDVGGLTQRLVANMVYFHALGVANREQIRTC